MRHVRQRRRYGRCSACISSMPARPHKRLFRAFGRVHAGEGVQAGLMMLCVFAIMTAYYMLKTSREALILSKTGKLPGQEIKAYAGGIMAVLLVGIVPAYDALVARVARLKLINISYLVSIAILLAFFVLHDLGIQIALPFFVWI